MDKKSEYGFQRRDILVAGAAFAAILRWSPSQAHQQKVGITDILFNRRSGMLEVAHKLILHDCQHVADDLWGFADFSISQERQQRFADYARRQFQLFDANTDQIILEAIGHEVDGPFFWVYEEAPIPTFSDELSVRNNILRDVWERQSNLVNIERGEVRKSLTFAGPTDVQTISLKSDVEKSPDEDAVQRADERGETAVARPGRSQNDNTP
ncbi:MAG: DUF6702 family protein [Pseudomonadota bacterium]